MIDYAQFESAQGLNWYALDPDLQFLMDLHVDQADRAYKAWAEEHGETAVSHKTFASLMSERGFAKTKTKVGALYSGVGLRTDDHYDSPKAAQSVPRQSRFDHDDDGEEI